MAEQKDPAETVDPVVDRADPPETGVDESASSVDESADEAPAADAGQSTPADTRPESPAPVRARATVATAGALPGDLPATSPATATTYRATGSASPAGVPLPGQREGSSARASATVPGSSRVTAGAVVTPASRASTPAVYRSGPVNPEPPEPAQPPE
ncbi:hypothetical protein F8271_31570, partial [Micromonospora sp. ALFpr18c]